MKKILIGIALILAAGSTQAALESNAKDKSPYVEDGRLESSRMSGIVDWVITDKKTGCQYMVISGGSNQIQLLGCFDEYKTK